MLPTTKQLAEIMLQLKMGTRKPTYTSTGIPMYDSERWSPNNIHRVYITPESLGVQYYLAEGVFKNYVTKFVTLPIEPHLWDEGVNEGLTAILKILIWGNICSSIEALVLDMRLCNGMSFTLADFMFLHKGLSSLNSRFVRLSGIYFIKPTNLEATLQTVKTLPDVKKTLYTVSNSFGDVCKSTGIFQIERCLTVADEWCDNTYIRQSVYGFDTALVPIFDTAKNVRDQLNTLASETQRIDKYAKNLLAKTDFDVLSKFCDYVSNHIDTLIKHIETVTSSRDSDSLKDLARNIKALSGIFPETNGVAYKEYLSVLSKEDLEPLIWIWTDLLRHSRSQALVSIDGNSVDLTEPDGVYVKFLQILDDLLSLRASINEPPLSSYNYLSLTQALALLNVLDDVFDADEDIYLEDEVDFSDEDDEDELSNPETEHDPVDPMVLATTVSNIMNIYDALYHPFFENQPDGIWTPDGIVGVDKDGGILLRKTGLAYAKIVYAHLNAPSGNKLNAADYHMEMDSSFLNSDATLVYNYCPNLHIRNIFGVYRKQDGTLGIERNWVKFRVMLQKTTETYVHKILKDYSDNQIAISTSLIELFTTCVVADTFDVTKAMSIAIKADCIAGDNSGKGYKQIFTQFMQSNPFGVAKGSMELVNNESYDLGIHRALLVFDQTKYNKEILFSYKAVKDIIEGGGTITASKTLLGRQVDGKHYTFNFEAPNMVVGLALAGTGSGKGVVTLSMLANFIANGMPVALADWKPDMAGVLWDLERKTGARILAIDSVAGESRIGQRPVRDYGTGRGAPYIEHVSSSLNVISYVKMIQIMCSMALARQTKYGVQTSDSEKMMFILDEAQSMNRALCTLREQLITYRKDNAPKKGTEPTEEYVYVKKLLSVIKSLDSELSAFQNTSGRVGYVGCIMLGQSPDAVAWSDGAIKRDPIGNMVGNCSMKMLGRQAIDSNKYSMGTCEPAGREFLNTMGYFAVIPGSLATKAMSNQVKVIKSYLVLNENDYDPTNPGVYTNGMLQNLTDPAVRQLALDDIYPNGQRNPLVGFHGLLDYLGKHTPNFNMNTNLSKGYDLIEILLTDLGIIGEGTKHPDIESYLFDHSIDSLYTCGEMRVAIVGKTTIQNAAERQRQGGTTDDDYDDDYDTSDGTTSPTNNTKLPYTVTETTSPPLNSAPVPSNTAPNPVPTPNVDFDDTLPNTHPNRPVPPSPNTFKPTRAIPQADTVLAQNYTQSYNEPLAVSEQKIITKTLKKGGLNIVYGLHYLTKMFLEEIDSKIGLARVTNVSIEEGVIIVNNVAFAPTLSPETLENLPLDLRSRAERGQWGYLIRLSEFVKFKGLRELRLPLKLFMDLVDDEGWGRDLNRVLDKIFKKFKTINELYIDDERYSRIDSNYKTSTKTEKFDSQFRLGSMAASMVGGIRSFCGLPSFAEIGNATVTGARRAYDSRPARVVRGVAGAGGIYMAASLLGSLALPVSIVLGALAIGRSLNKK